MTMAKHGEATDIANVADRTRQWPPLGRYRISLYS